MRVLHLLGPLRPSGMERMLVSAAPLFRSEGVSIIVVGQGAEHPFEGELERAGYDVYTVPSLRQSSGRAALAALLGEVEADVVHVHTEGFWAGTVWTVRRSTRAPIVRTVHNVFQNKGRGRASRRGQALLVDHLVSRFIAVSPDVQRNEQLYGRSCQTILNWVDPRFDALGQNRRATAGSSGLAVIVGNASPVKNHVVGLRAVERAGMRLAYHGDETNASVEEVAILDRLQAAGRLDYRGTGEPSRSLAAATVFLLPSLYEGMCIALGEAVAARVPCIINEVPGLSWAAEARGVTVIDNVQSIWDGTVAAFGAGKLPANVSGTFPDLSAKRGVREHVDLYKSISG